MIIQIFLNSLEHSRVLQGFLLIHETLFYAFRLCSSVQWWCKWNVCKCRWLRYLTKNRLSCEKTQKLTRKSNYELFIYFAKLNFVVAITHFLWIPQKINKSRRYVNKLFVNTDRMNEKDIRLLKYYKPKNLFLLINSRIIQNMT